MAYTVFINVKIDVVSFYLGVTRHRIRCWTSQRIMLSLLHFTDEEVEGIIVK